MPGERERGDIPRRWGVLRLPGNQLARMWRALLVERAQVGGETRRTKPHCPDARAGTNVEDALGRVSAGGKIGLSFKCQEEVMVLYICPIVSQRLLLRTNYRRM
jgi:hypothetical protein